MVPRADEHHKSPDHSYSPARPSHNGNAVPMAAGNTAARVVTSAHRCHQLVRLLDLSRPERWPGHPEAQTLYAAIEAELRMVLEGQHT